MKLDIKADKIGTQTIIESIERGDFILNVGGQALSVADREAAVGKLLKKLLEEVERIPDSVVAAADKKALRDASQTLSSGTPEKEKTLGIETFFSSLRKCFGETATIATMAINLARLLP